MVLSDAEIKVLYADETGFILDESPAALLDFAHAIEAEVRKQDDALILQLVEALEDLTGAGEEAWSEERPCVRIGKEASIAGRARLGEKT